MNFELQPALIDDVAFHGGHQEENDRSEIPQGNKRCFQIIVQVAGQRLRQPILFITLQSTCTYERENMEHDRRS